MFYICGICDADTGKYFGKIYISNSATAYTVSRDVVTCSFKHIRNIQAGVFDSTDNSIEWYDILDLLKIVESSNVEINGLELKYYVNFKKDGTARPTNIPSLREYNLITTISVPDREFMQTIAKYKMMGIDIDLDGTLKKFDSRFCKDGVVVLPDEVRGTGIGIFSNFDRSIPLYKFIVGKNFNFNDIGVISGILNCGDKNVVVFEDDVSISLDNFIRIKNNVYSRGTLTHGDFNKIMDRLIKSNTRIKGRFFDYNKIPSRKYFLADSENVYVLDFINFKTYTTKNDGSIRY